mgnify:CR=1 FL=1
MFVEKVTKKKIKEETQQIVLEGNQIFATKEMFNKYDTTLAREIRILSEVEKIWITYD